MTAFLAASQLMALRASSLRLRKSKTERFRYGLVLCFRHRSAKIEPVPTISLLMGSGGGWIALGLVVMDRF
jgi:hypothetical protein